MDDKSTSAYLKAIYALEENGKGATTVSIATALNIRPASVTEMLKKLAAAKCIVYSPYHGAKLTDKGRVTAKKTIRKHRLLETFLKKILKLSDGEICKQASAMEYALSDHADQQLCVFLHRPKEGPDHGDIPHCTKKISCGKCLKTNYNKVAKPNIY